MSSERRLWVVPLNDAEAVEIRKLLEARGERVLVTGQGWGATWAGLEPGVRDAIAGFSGGSGGGTVYGVELGGPNPYRAINIDHHKYGEEDRSHAASSLEQAAAILGVELDRWQRLIALNDRGYIPAMITEAGATAAEIEAVRRADRSAQGVTAAQEAAAARDLEEHAEFSGDRVKVWCAEGSTAAHSDGLYGKAREILLMGPDEWNYYGPRHRVLAAMFEGRTGKTWCGGAEASGYFGIAAPEAGERERILAWWV